MDILGAMGYMGDSSALDVGPQTDGTYNVPDAATPTNTPWDTGGGTLGSYGGQALDILKYGIGAAVNAYNNNQLLDYKRYEATQGGAFQQGVPANGLTVNSKGVGVGMGALLIVGAIGLTVLLARRR